MARALMGFTLSMVITMVLAAGVAAQTTPEFKLGFRTLADLIPQVVGQPLENEHWGANGDSLQQTTRGLMVWRKADNWTAFTDGNRTWINGPRGLESRPNADRFPWETGERTSVSTLHNRIESAAIQLTDLPQGYTYVRRGWTGDSYTAVIELAAGLTGGPRTVEVNMKPVDPSWAPEPVRRENCVDGYPCYPIQLGDRWIATAVERYYFASGGRRVAVKQLVFAVDDVLVMVALSDPEDRTRLPAAISLAERVAKRLVGEQVPSGPAFMLREIP